VTIIILRMNSYRNLISPVRLLGTTGMDFWELAIERMATRK
jgi:hypothetical protein